MAYQELDQWNSPNYTPAAQCAQVFGEPRNPTTFTIHHWGDPSWGQTFEGVVSYLCDGNRPSPTSAHFVVEAGRSACIVSPDDVAWHAGNAHGNATSIGIECNPLERDGDYQTIGEVIAHLRTIYGDLPLVPHSHWMSTDCPGTYDLARLDAIARGATSQPAVNPVPEEDIVTPDDINAIAQATATEVLNRTIQREGGPTGGTDVRAVIANFDSAVSNIVNAVNGHTDATIKAIPAPPAIDPAAIASQIAAHLTGSQVDGKAVALELVKILNAGAASA